MAHVDLSTLLETDAGLKPKDIPDKVWEIFEEIPLFVPDEPETAESEVYERAQRGHCMTCDGELGELTMVSINRAGIVMMYCSGACYTDMQVTGWLEEQYEDLVTKIKFRGGQNADGEQSE